MIGYFYILISTLFNVSKGFCSKKISGFVITLRDNLEISLYRNIICCIASVATVFMIGNVSFDPSPAEITICAISGTTMAIFMSAWLFAIKSDSYMLVSACASSSFIVPAILGIFFLDEKPTLNKGISFIIIVAALFFLLKYNTKLNGKTSLKSIILLAIVLLSQGINQSMQKMYTYYFPDKDVSYYTLYASVFTVVSIVSLLPFSKKGENSRKFSIVFSPKIFFQASIMALALYGSSYFQTLASGHVDAIILYPVSSALSLGGASAMSAIFFGEKMNQDSIIGVVLIFIALLFAK